jgi:CO/xanthine dehydrogenase FAD-binding subunit
MRIVRPGTVEEALAALAEHGGRARILAGGTDLVVRLKDGLETPEVLVSLASCAGLRDIRERGSEIVAGPLVTHEDLARSPLVQRVAPVLAHAAAEVGSVQIRNRGTVGGNLVNASPAADLVPPLVVLEAVVVLRSRDSERTVPVAWFATGPKATVIRPDELLVEIRWPQPASSEVQSFAKLGQRRALAIAKVSLALRARRDGPVLRDVRLAFGAVAPTVIRAPAAERVLEGVAPTPEVVGRAVAEAEREVSPIDDVRSTAWWRRSAAGTLLRRALAAA